VGINKQTDKDILIRLKKGDHAAFEELYWIYNRRLYNFVLSMLFDRSLAEDITQTCFLKIWENRKNIDEDKGFASYLHTIAKNLVYRETERELLKSRFLAVLQERQQKTDNTVQETIDAHLLQEHINELIEKLPPARKRIFIMSKLQGLSNKEIAEKLSISEKTVETQVYRSIQFLKTYFKDYFILTGLLFLASSI
jgi:RNA polymerase sigma-70 factor (ECF subfamily)